MAGKIFISYRRDDSRYQARGIYDAFARGLPRENIFMDVDTIAPGVDFVRVLEGWVEQCEVLLVLMGRGWANSTDPKSRKRRLDNPKDFVRIEIRGALSRDIPVVPVLLDGAELPDEAELPDDIKPLLNRHAEFVDFRTFDTDVQRLIKKLAIGSDADPMIISESVPETPREGLLDSNARGSAKQSEIERDLADRDQERKPRGKQTRWLTTAVAVLLVTGSLVAVLIGAFESWAPRSLGGAEVAATPNDVDMARQSLERQLREAEQARKAAEAKLARTSLYRNL
jgi:TIR domain